MDINWIYILSYLESCNTSYHVKYMLQRTYLDVDALLLIIYAVMDISTKRGVQIGCWYQYSLTPSPWPTQVT